MIEEDPEAKFILITTDKQEFYEKLGFSTVKNLEKEYVLMNKDI